MKANSDSTKTILIITVGFLIVGILSNLHWPLYTAAAVGLIGAFSAKSAEWINWLWMKLAWILSLIVPNILLSVVFYIFLFPIAILSRLFGNKNALQLKKGTSSTYIESNKVFTSKSFQNPW